MVTRRKPDPEPYLRAAQLLGLAPGDCLVIEDSPAGIRAGKAAGCTVLGYTGSSIRQDVSAQISPFLISSLPTDPTFSESFSVLIL